MQPQENPARVLLVLHGDSTEGFRLKNLYYLECSSLLLRRVSASVRQQIIHESLPEFSVWHWRGGTIYFCECCLQAWSLNKEH